MNTTEQDALAFLANEKLAVLSTRAEDDSIDATAVYFAVDEHLNFYVMTKTDTRKFRNMKAHPGVSLTIASDEHMKTIEVKGEAEPLEFTVDSENKLAELITKAQGNRGAWMPPVARLQAGEFVILRITPSWLRYGVFQEGTTPSEYFTQIVG